MKEKALFKHIYETGKKLGVEVYVVGGYVRDTLLGIESRTDIDFVVVGSGVAFAKAFDEQMNQKGSLVLFESFDTARYIMSDFEIEFAGARKEAYEKNSRKPVVQEATLEEDLSRRDFTVNALARRIGAGGPSTKIIDPYDGQKDLAQRLIRTPLDPDETFSEDPLRMLRAARFAAQLQFDIEPDTYEALARNKERLHIVSAERIKEELFKLLATPVPSVGLWILHKTGLCNEFLPEVSLLEGVEEVKGYLHKDNLAHTFKVVDNIAEMSDRVLLRYTGLMHDIAKPGTKQFDKKRGWTFDMHEHLGKKMVREIGKRLRMSKDETEYVAKLVRWHLYPIALMDDGVTDSPVRRLVVNLKDDLQDLLILCRADITTGNQRKLVKRLKNYDKLEMRIAEVMEKDKLRNFHSPVRGEDIMKECKLKPGPTVGKIKKDIEDAKNNIDDEFLRKAKEDLSKKAQGKKILEAAFKEDVLEEKLSASEGQEAPEFTLSIKKSFWTFAFDEGRAKEKIISKIKETLSENKELVEGKLENVEYKLVDLAKESGMNLSVAVLAFATKKLELSRTKQDLPGKNREEVIQYFKQNKEITDVKVDFWPFWVKKVPLNRSRIEIKIEVGK